MPTTSTPKLDALAIIVLHHLQSRLGKRQGISAAALSAATGLSQRTQRSAISLLREAGHPVVGTPDTGYYIAQNADELREWHAFFRARTMHSLVLEARVLRKSLPELLGQLSLEMYVPTI
jgi:predicted DNA-binding transcriptional regulator YafY